ncbi:MAG: hypothetical protein P1P82_03605 [Bacteroidales bacterium]|nr:hypothetical protein [Bacteroidales bacterium]MDT8431764.1 hypothetical protein [Bacteroidales bacterium]
MIRLRLVFVLFLAGFTGFTGLQAQNNVSVSGYVRNYTGVLTAEPNHFSIIQNTLDLNFEKRADKVAFTVNPFLYHYTDRKLELGLREAYLDMYFRNFYIRVGKQRILFAAKHALHYYNVLHFPFQQLVKHGVGQMLNGFGDRR